ncbi:DUF5626 family protein [Levilactobacillus fujinensis]|uniref:DUF5626 family protein n=1 Tax=Levilactobacillus fujinensis TaxID=2486024 RepID=A0ABW1TCV2_9LACO|nr:DUF5626 family protein [Levilactobacillus fujinensis]
MKKLFITMFTCAAIFFGGGALQADAATMNVSHDSALSWSASYKVVTSGNQIKSVKDVQASAKIGRIVKKHITRDSASKVTLHITRAVGAIVYKVHLTASVHNGKLTVTTT